jgi:hypothetical protein
VVRSWGRVGYRHRPRQLVTCHPTVDDALAECFSPLRTDVELSSRCEGPSLRPAR